MWGIPAKHVLDAGRLRAREGMAEVDTRQRGPRCKAKNGVGAARLPPHSPCCLFSNLSTLALQLCMPPNSVFRRLLPVSPAFHPLSLRLSPTNAPRQTRFTRHSSRPSSCLASSVKPTALYPAPVSCPHIDPTFIVLSADLAHINIAIARRPSHPPQRHTHPLTSRRQPDTHVASPDPQPHAHPQPPICPPTPRSSFALDLRQLCACQLPSRPSA